MSDPVLRGLLGQVKRTGLICVDYNILYSEDLQHLRIYEGKLTIVNPFII
ncbi:MAG: hypothetical protein KF734_14515 [Saprospiraceae bacterium]|nr:hypothetical protein [Saprospiraceae bacterium]